MFQDIFLSLNLPAFIIRGKLLLVEVTLFNYLEEELEVAALTVVSVALRCLSGIATLILFTVIYSQMLSSCSGEAFRTRMNPFWSVCIIFIMITGTKHL